MEAALVYDAKAILGEGPVWDADRGELMWVDIEKGELHFFNPDLATDEHTALGSRVGMAVPTSDGKILVALENGLAMLEKGGAPVIFADPESGRPNMRFNDGKCAPEGRLWVGSMDVDAKENAGALYRLDADLTLTRCLGGITVSNGLAWSPDGTTMYYIDSPTYRVSAFDYDRVNGEIGRRRTVIEVPGEHGSPDGMSMDADGMLWIAHWEGGNVTRWDPATGRIREMIHVPAPRTTSCAFGGPGLDTLYITTARIGLKDAMLEAFPASGGLFACRPGVRGIQSRKFIRR
jgi:sugar lactone lactonase YvrE